MHIFTTNRDKTDKKLRSLHLCQHLEYCQMKPNFFRIYTSVNGQKITHNKDCSMLMLVICSGSSQGNCQNRLISRAALEIVLIDKAREKELMT